MFKKLLLGLGIAGFLGLGSITMVNAQLGGQFGDVGGAGGVGVAGAGEEKNDGLITVIKSFLNRVLGLLSLIVLGLLLWGGFKMVTAAGDEAKYKEGFKILKQAAIGLAVIGLSWFIVSIIFRVIGGATAGA